MSARRQLFGELLFYQVPTNWARLLRGRTTVIFMDTAPPAVSAVATRRALNVGLW